jgi:bifunctional DNase/RNase
MAILCRTAGGVNRRCGQCGLSVLAEPAQCVALQTHLTAAAPGRFGAGKGAPIMAAPPPSLERESFVQQMQIYGVSFDMVGKQPIVLLKTVDGNKFLPIWIGHPEAAAILMKLQGASTPRPMTHDLLSDVLDQMEAKCERVSVTELRDNTFYASITITVNGSEVEIDSRPSDALALAVRVSAPIFAAEEVIEESAIEFEHEVEDTEEVVEKFKDFLDEVSPEDFAQGGE